MPQQLTDLAIDEVSLVDFGANSEVVNGQKIARSRVALFKRDDSGDYLSPAALREHMDRLEKSRKRKDDPGSQAVNLPDPPIVDNPPVRQQPETKKEKKMKLKKILKAGGAGATRSEICAAVAQRAAKIAKAEGTAVTGVLYAQAWTPELYAAYDAAPVEVTKVERKTFQATAAEAELDRRARQRMRKSAMSYPQACSAELTEDPGLYQKYQDELAAGTTYPVPEPGPGQDHPLYKQDDGDECPECGEEIGDGDKFCSACGADIAKCKAAKARSRKRTA